MNSSPGMYPRDKLLRLLITFLYRVPFGSEPTGLSESGVGWFSGIGWLVPTGKTWDPVRSQQPRCRVVQIKAVQKLHH